MTLVERIDAVAANLDYLDGLAARAVARAHANGTAVNSEVGRIYRVTVGNPDEVNDDRIREMTADVVVMLAAQTARLRSAVGVRRQLIDSVVQVTLPDLADVLEEDIDDVRPRALEILGERVIERLGLLAVVLVRAEELALWPGA